MAKQSIRSIRKGSVQWNEEDRLQMVSIQISVARTREIYDCKGI